MCYEGFYACKRSAESQTLKAHPVASKTLTQKRPVYAAPERLVGDFSFSIVCLQTPSQAAGVCVFGLGFAVSRCLADPTQQPGNDTSNPAHTVRSSSEPCNVPLTRHPDPTQHSHLFVITGVIFWLLTNAIVTHKHTSEHSGGGGQEFQQAV